jgi:hypothetical protein
MSCFFWHICECPHTGAYRLKEFYILRSFETNPYSESYSYYTVTERVYGVVTLQARSPEIGLPTGTRAIMINIRLSGYHEIFHGFPQWLHANAGIILQLVHDRFLPNPLNLSVILQF